MKHFRGTRSKIFSRIADIYFWITYLTAAVVKSWDCLSVKFKCKKIETQPLQWEFLSRGGGIKNTHKRQYTTYIQQPPLPLSDYLIQISSLLRGQRVTTKVEGFWQILQPQRWIDWICISYFRCLHKNELLLLLLFFATHNDHEHFKVKVSENVNFHHLF